MYELIKKKPVYFPDPQRHKITMSDECKDFISKVIIKNLTAYSYWKKTQQTDWEPRKESMIS